MPTDYLRALKVMGGEDDPGETPGMGKRVGTKKQTKGRKKQSKIGAAIGKVFKRRRPLKSINRGQIAV